MGDSSRIERGAVPVFDDPPAEDVRNAMKERKPFVVRNRDIGPCTDTWTWEYVSDKMGDVPVKVHVSINQKLDFINKNFLYKTLPFDELVRRISNRGRDFFIQPGEMYYLRSLGPDPRGRETADFMRDFPQIARDLKLPTVFDEADFFSAVLRMSSARIQLWTHYDIMDNILIQVRGKKRVILWPPTQVKNLYLTKDKSRVIDVDKPQVDEFPKFAQAESYECILNEGDMIFIPALWFHNITAIESSIGVNVFWKNLPHELYDKKDPYGNADLTPATKAFRLLQNGLESLNGLPNEYKDFYIRRMIVQLESQLNRSK